MSASLEDEKKILLDRMHASRDAYLSTFNHPDENIPADTLDAFPRSHTFKFLTRHPYSAALGLLAVLAVMPRDSLRRAASGGAGITAGLLGNKARILMMRQVLPSVVHLLRSHNSRSRERLP